MSYFSKSTKSTALLLILSLLTYLLKYILNVFFAKNLEPHLYGDVIIAFKALNVFSILTLAGTTASAKRFLALYIKTENTTKVSNYLRWNLRLVTYTFSLSLGIALIFWCLIFIFDWLGIKDLGSYHLFVYILLGTPLLALILLLSGYLACNQHIVIAYICRNLMKYVLLIICLSIAVFLFDSALDYVSISIIFFSAFVVLIIIEAFLLINKASPIFRIYLSERRDAKSEQEWLRTSLRLIISNFMFLIICILDLAIVEIFSSQEADVGFYSAILAITGILWVLPGGVFQLMKPSVSSLISSTEGKIKLQKQLGVSNLLLLTTILIVAYGIVVYSRTLLLHFGTAYLVAEPALLIVIVGCCVGVFSQPSTVLLIYSGHEKTLVNINFIEMGLLVLLGIPLTILYGIEGIAIAFITAVTVKTVMNTYYAKIKTGLKPLTII